MKLGNANCTAARTDFSDCLRNAQSSGPTSPDDITNCLCAFGNGIVTPWHPDWTDQLESCIVCVEDAAGLDRAVSILMQTTIGVQNSFGGLCKRTLNLEKMVQRAHDIQLENHFPLRLPNADLHNDTKVAKRDVITRTTIVTVTESRSLGPPSMGNPNTLTATAPIITLSPSRSSSSQGATSKCNQDNCLRQCTRELPAVAAFCATYTKSVCTATTGFPAVVSHCGNNPTRISSACSCLETLPPLSSSSHHSSTTPSSTTRSSTTQSSIKSTTSSLPAPSASNWLTLPPSYAMKSCAASSECFSASNIFTACMNYTTTTDVWDCFCVANNDEWKKWVGACANCTMKALPSLNNTNEPIDTMVDLVLYSQNAYCNVTEIGLKGRDKVVEIGQVIAVAYDSPIEFFNMTLVDAPIVIGGIDPPAISVKITGVNSATIIGVSSTSSTALTGTSASTAFASLSSTAAESASSQLHAVPSGVRPLTGA
ncbi:hypothetical protein EG329_010870 [Mollisiaceae sp. DMI_Dod_QoI]|nr:hypothetical protein EG329_010870 [Helotiales sp. DMI_Dod_QoI]